MRARVDRRRRRFRIRLRRALAFCAAAATGAAADTVPLLHLDFDGPAAEVRGCMVAGRSGRAVRAAAGSSCAATLPAEGNVDLERGTIAFWFRASETLHPLPAEEESNIVVVDRSGAHVDGNPAKAKDKILNVFFAKPGSVRLRGETFDAAGAYYGTLLEYPRVYGGRWYHFAFTWDSAGGELRQYLNARLEQSIDASPWTPQSLGGKLRIGNPTLAIDDLAIFGRALSGEEITDLCGLEPGEGLTDEGVVAYSDDPVDLSPLRATPVLSCGFDRATDLEDWVMEGSGGCELRDGRLLLRSRRATGGHIVFWNRRNLPEDALIEYDFAPLSESGLCILFFCARGSGGRDLFDPGLAPRDGNFSRYVRGDVECYHVSYYRNQGAATGVCNLRKDPGMPLLGVGADRIEPEPGGVYRLSMLKQGARMRFFVDGRLVIDADDDPALFGPSHGAGKLGLRQMAPTEASYDNLVVYQVGAE